MCFNVCMYVCVSVRESASLAGKVGPKEWVLKSFAPTRNLLLKTRHINLIYPEILEDISHKNSTLTCRRYPGWWVGGRGVEGFVEASRWRSGRSWGSGGCVLGGKGWDVVVRRERKREDCGEMEDVEGVWGGAGCRSEEGDGSGSLRVCVGGMGVQWAE